MVDINYITYLPIKCGCVMQHYYYTSFQCKSQFIFIIYKKDYDYFLITCYNKKYKLKGKRMRKLLLSLSIISLLLGIFFLTFSILKRLEELKNIEECRNIPDCMYCTPTWIGNKEIIFNGLGVIFTCIAIVLLIMFILKTKKYKSHH